MRMLPPSMRPLVDNLFSSYAYVGLMALITLFVVPIYVHTLGSAQWGSVALCVTIQGFLFSLDIAFGPLMLRDVARAAATANPQTIYARFLRLYATAAFSAFVIAQSVLLLFAQHRSAQGAPMSDDLFRAMCLALLQFLFQFANNAAIGYWNGLEKQRYANLRLAGFACAKHGVALLLLTQWHASATAYMLPFASISILEFILNHRRVRRDRDAITADKNAGKNVAEWRDIAAFGAAAALGFLTAQIDRGFLFIVLPTENYGLYFLISSLLLSLLSLQVPIYRAFVPRMIIATSPRRVAFSMLKISLLLLVLPSLLMAAFPDLVLRLWLHDPTLAAAAALPFRLLMLAMACTAIFSPCAALLLHYHRNRATALINAIILVAQVLVLTILTPRLGMLAGALAWFACGTIQLICAAWIWWRPSPGSN
ncbi:hypothetical protein ELE36_18915 [Pseudolysobacter antarcticus]|uniref:Polysaccharide biosynthesis protein n=1 Tax=Pseudolysobacter antarcticus TaxID=2511995 RepID=A0A411HP60_9GAMM|nr:hypothetical protein [Pseudolysobacter antarcticus]QBB72271.1 hypothetical protein ELE36_18915 [Pseudolysobacter antarcticus]